MKDTSTNDHPELQLTIDNGDLEGLKRVLNDYRFVDVEALIRYALVGMLESEDNRLYIRRNGELAVLTPNEKLIKSPDTYKN